jgi:hypothetical protein
MEPSDIRAQVWAPPSVLYGPLVADTEVTFVIPDTGTGVRLLTVVLLPSWPSLFSPQHFRLPFARTAQAWRSPTEIEVAVVIPETVTGEELFVVELLPS